MSISNFDKTLLIEQIRFIESAHRLSCEDDASFSGRSIHQDFHQRLWLRARCIVKQHDLAQLLTHAAGISRNIKILSLVVAALFGALGSIYSVTESQTINIYWLLLVLLGFNLISILLWLVGISLHVEGLSSGLLARLTGWLPARFQHKTSSSGQATADYTSAADRAWVNCSLGGAVGKWQLSKLTHQLWLLYLLSGLVTLILLLMVRQYDFVWGTTLLSDAAFISLTEILSQPLEWFGFIAPSAEQVQQSRIGVASTLGPDLRSSWAQFILGSLLCFGLLPRVLLLLFASVMSIRARNRFSLDLYLPYYISLRQRLMPLASEGLVVDADQSAAPESRPLQAAAVSHALPEHTKWMAVELGSHVSWPMASISAADNLGQVVDRESLADIRQRIQQQNISALAVAVDAARSPDRGIQRTIASLLSDTATGWLVLLQLSEQSGLSSKRMSAWYQLAQACDIPADHIISLGVEG